VITDSSFSLASQGRQIRDTLEKFRQNARVYAESQNTPTSSLTQSLRKPSNQLSAQQTLLLGTGPLMIQSGLRRWCQCYYNRESPSWSSPSDLRNHSRQQRSRRLPAPAHPSSSHVTIPASTRPVHD
jgi:hypothetical protein